METCEKYSPEYLRYLELLSKEYKTQAETFTEIINLQAIVNLPKGTEHFMSDLHGEYEAFYHILNNCSGVIREKVEMIFADSIETGIRNPQLPLIRDSAIASEYAWTFLHDAYTHDLPAIGELETLEQIWERRRNMKNGYGLLQKP